MQLTLLAVGRARDAPIEALVERYRSRLPWPLAVIEVTAGGGAGAEAERLLGKLPTDAVVVALDEAGSQLDSRGFARRLGAWRDDGRRRIVFVIGGADGLAPTIRDRADLVLSLGAPTWPHLLVRVLLAEQLYRAATILQGHPYHRD